MFPLLADPVFLGRAYSKTQPGTYLDRSQDYDSDDNDDNNKSFGDNNIDKSSIEESRQSSSKRPRNE